ncbi:hypothetical protein UFOVP1290_449 [uncultured Caudovirales phage]|uniref:Uncharacterized protein n=1 Tax=uncultured Caudovirales phage TaxID=2100421 RepID=A0A6J5RIV8_9CAUD|nr:hypothetical protein UFOVP1290_449 [uncultured Caudovirales phage]
MLSIIWSKYEKILTWEEQYKIAVCKRDLMYEDDHYNGCEFGYNCEFDFYPIFKKLSKLTPIEIVDYYTIRVLIPDDETANCWRLGIGKEEFEPEEPTTILLFILTKLPGCSNIKHNKKNKKLTLEWHF